MRNMKCNFRYKCYCRLKYSEHGEEAEICDEEDCILMQIRESFNMLNVVDTVTKLNFCMDVIKEMSKQKEGMVTAPIPKEELPKAKKNK